MYIIAVILGVAASTLFFAFYLEAELKLAKHGESTIFKEKK